MKKLLSILLATMMMITMTVTVFAAGPVARVGTTEYEDLQEAIKAAAPGQTVELLSDVTVDTWKMMSTILSIGSGEIITIDSDGLVIEGNNHTLTVNNVISAGNGNSLFHNMENFTMRNLKLELGANSGLSIESGLIENVTFNCGGTAISLGYPSSTPATGTGTGDVTIKDCKFNGGTAINYDSPRTGKAIIINNEFNMDSNKNVIILRGNEEFKNNTINSGRTVNVAEGSSLVEGNEFNNDVRFKVYNVATATIKDNKIDNLQFNDPTSPANSTFTDNELSEDAKTNLQAVGLENTSSVSAPVCAGEKDLNCDGVVTCDEGVGPGWDWNEEKGVCEFKGLPTTGEFVVVNTAVK